MWRQLSRTPLTWVVVAVAGIMTAGGLYWFQPWKLVTDKVVKESLPAVAPSQPAASATASTPAAPVPGESAAPGNQLIAAGVFVSHEHATSGAAELVQLADGRRQLLLRGLDTSDGPDLRVWLTDQPVLEGTAGWRVFDDGNWVELAKLKGNRGDQAYDIPASVDAALYRSVTIWCKRFSVSFGAAPLAAT